MLRLWLKGHPLLVSGGALVVGLGVLGLVPTDTSVASLIPVRLVLALFMMGLIAFLGGRKAITPSFKGVGFALRKSAYLLGLTFVVGMSGLAMLFAQGTGMVQGWYWQLVQAILLCVVVGLFEESLFRGIILSGLLAYGAKTRSGVMRAAIISSLIFGFVHVLPFFLYGQVTTIPAFMQALFKTLGTGITGLLLAAIFIKTRSVWAIAAVHGLNDLFALISGALYGGAVATNYVNNDPSVALMYVVVYFFTLILYIPVLVVALRTLLSVSVPTTGWYFTRKRKAPSLD